MHILPSIILSSYQNLHLRAIKLARVLLYSLSGNQVIIKTVHECGQVHPSVLDPNGHIVFFDIQFAKSGTFTVPGVIDLEVYRPGDMIETSWIYFKGDPQAGPQPGHPFERPFDDSAKFSIDIVRANETADVLHEIMRESSELLQSLRRGIDRETQHLPILPLSGKVARHLADQVTTPRTSRDSTSSCKHQFIGGTIYRWSAPKTLEGDSAVRLKLTTDIPSTTHFSGRFQVSHDDATFSSSMRMGHSETAGFSTINVVGVVLAVMISLLLSCWVVVRLGRRPQRIVLE